MRLQIGTSDFGEARIKNLTSIDKTLFIKEVLDNSGIKVTLITRPRRFGKTFNLSTLHHFLAAEVNGVITHDLFTGLNITKVDNGSYLAQQGKFPVISVSFKDAKNKSFPTVLIKLQDQMRALFRSYQYLQDSTKLTLADKELLRSYFKQPEQLISDLQTSLVFLCELLYKHYGVKPWLLIDEYDTPIQSGYLHDYYDDITDLMRNMFGAALKDNIYLERAVLTGILRVAKESLFSGLNNLKVYSIFQSQYSEHFGFTETEVHNLLQLAGLSNKETEVKQWYNGYIFGGTTVYNPWSIVNYIDEKGLLQAYWINTSDDKLIRNLLIDSDDGFKTQVDALLKGEVVIQEIDENMVFGNLKTNELAVWSLLLMSGYLKIVQVFVDDMGNKLCHCAIPNWEVKTMYCKMIESWLSSKDDNGSWYRNFLGSLLKGDVERFGQDFGQVLAATVSTHDMARSPENFYHGFMLGLTASLRPAAYEVKSNKESGLGRYDVVILPKDVTNYAIIFEFKSVRAPKTVKTQEDLELLLEQEAQQALAQIIDLKYTTEVQQRGCKKVLKIGLAFAGKVFALRYTMTMD